jgi:hypothetical protein
MRKTFSSTSDVTVQFHEDLHMLRGNGKFPVMNNLEKLCMSQACRDDLVVQWNRRDFEIRPETMARCEEGIN